MFADGKVWGWLVGAPYAALVGLELIGQEAWRTAATPYLDIAILIGLTALGWRANLTSRAPRPASEVRTAVRADLAAMRLAADEAALDLDLPSDAAAAPLVAGPPPGFNLVRLIGRLFATLVFVLFMFLLLVAIGLGIVRWARGWWYVVVPAIALLTALVFWWMGSVPREAEPSGPAGKTARPSD